MASKPRTTKTAPVTANAVAPPPADEIALHMEKVAALTTRTLLEAVKGEIDIQISIHTVSVRVNEAGFLEHGDADGVDAMSSLGFAAQAGLLLGAARATEALETDAGLV